MDALDCRSPTRCRTCEHADARGGCALEEALALALAPPPRVAIPVALAHSDARRAALA